MDPKRASVSSHTIPKCQDIGRSNANSISFREEFLHTVYELRERRFLRQKNVVPTLKGHKLRIGNRRGNETALLEGYDIVVPAVEYKRR